MSISRGGPVAALAILLVGTLGSCDTSSSSQDEPGTVNNDRVTRGGVGTFDGTEDEYIAAVVTCLEQAGWDAVADFNQHSIEVPSVTFEQRREFQRARDRCDEELGTPVPEPPMTRAEIGELFDYYVSTMSECVRGHGYQVPDPPSRDTFIETYYSPEDSWSPYDGLPPDISEADWEELNLDCPQDPEDAR